MWIRFQGAADASYLSDHLPVILFPFPFPTSLVRSPPVSLGLPDLRLLFPLSRKIRVSIPLHYSSIPPTLLFDPSPIHRVVSKFSSFSPFWFLFQIIFLFYFYSILEPYYSIKKSILRFRFLVRIWGKKKIKSFEAFGVDAVELVCLLEKWHRMLLFLQLEFLGRPFSFSWN